MPQNIQNLTPQGPEGPVVRSIVRYHLPDELPFLSYSIGFEHGPGITRDGQGAPKMLSLHRWWETTTDPDEQRLGSWYVDLNAKKLDFAETTIKLAAAIAQYPDLAARPKACH